MHELSVTQSVLEIALTHARHAGAERILRIDLKVGALSGIVGESVQFYFDFLAKDTIAAGATLAFHHVPARFRCLACGASYESEGGDWTCPLCGELWPQVIGGREFLVESIDVE